MISFQVRERSALVFSDVAMLPSMESGVRFTVVH